MGERETIKPKMKSNKKIKKKNAKKHKEILRLGSLCLLQAKRKQEIGKNQNMHRKNQQSYPK